MRWSMRGKKGKAEEMGKLDPRAYFHIMERWVIFSNFSMCVFVHHSAQDCKQRICSENAVVRLHN